MKEHQLTIFDRTWSAIVFNGQRTLPVGDEVSKGDFVVVAAAGTGRRFTARVNEIVFGGGAFAQIAITHVEESK